MEDNSEFRTSMNKDGFRQMASVGALDTLSTVMDAVHLMPLRLSQIIGFVIIIVI